MLKTSLSRLFILILLSWQLIWLYGCAATAPQIRAPLEEPSTAYLKKVHPKVILVLGSGSARGFAHAGVLKVLEENHIPIDMIVGTSAGSIVGALYADHPDAFALEQLLLTTPRDEVIDFSLMNIIEGPISGNNLQNFLNKHLQNDYFEQLDIPFVAVATDLDTGNIHVFGSGPVAPAVNASSSAPPFFRPVKLYGRTYIDGGMVDPVAVDVAKRFHPQVIIAVNLNATLSKELPTNNAGVFLRGFSMMLMRLNDYSSADAEVIISPEPDDTDMFDGSKQKRAYLMQMGEAAAKNALPEIKKILARKKIRLS